jgi:hypothetical protein
VVALDEYQEVRSHDNWFVIRPGHEQFDVERVVGARGPYLVVQKDGV